MSIYENWETQRYEEPPMIGNKVEIKLDINAFNEGIAADLLGYDQQNMQFRDIGNGELEVVRDKPLFNIPTEQETLMQAQQATAALLDKPVGEVKITTGGAGHPTQQFSVPVNSSPFQYGAAPYTPYVGQRRFAGGYPQQQQQFYPMNNNLRSDGYYPFAPNQIPEYIYNMTVGPVGNNIPSYQDFENYKQNTLDPFWGYKDPMYSVPYSLVKEPAPAIDMIPAGKNNYKRVAYDNTIPQHSSWAKHSQKEENVLEDPEYLMSTINEPLQLNKTENDIRKSLMEDRERMLREHEAKYGRGGDAIAPDSKIKREVQAEDKIRDQRMAMEQSGQLPPLGQPNNMILGVNGTPAQNNILNNPNANPISARRLDLIQALANQDQHRGPVNYNPLPYQANMSTPTYPNMSFNSPFYNPYYRPQQPQGIQMITQEQFLRDQKPFLNPYDPNSYTMTIEEWLNYDNEGIDVVGLNPLAGYNGNIFNAQQSLAIAKKREEKIFKEKETFVHIQKAGLKSYYSINGKEWTDDVEKKFNDHWHDFLYPPEPKKLSPEEMQEQFDYCMIRQAVPVDENNRYPENIRDIQEMNRISAEMQKYNPDDMGFVEWMNNIVPMQMLDMEIDRIWKAKHDLTKLGNKELFQKELDKFDMNERLKAQDSAYDSTEYTNEGVPYPEWWDFDALPNVDNDADKTSMRDTELINKKDEVQDWVYEKILLCKDKEGHKYESKKQIPFRGTAKEFMENQDRKEAAKEIRYREYSSDIGVKGRCVQR